MYNYNSNRADIEASLGYQYAFINRGKTLVTKGVTPFSTRFTIYDASKCISPEYKLKKGSMSSFKCLGNYEFTPEDSSFVTDTFIPNLSNYLGRDYEESYKSLRELKDSEGNLFFSVNREDSDKTTGDDEHMLTKVIVFGNNRAAQYARDSYLDSHPSAHWIKGTSFVKDGEWLIRYATSQNFEGTRFNEVVIDGSLLLSVNTAEMTRITNELRAAMESERRG